MTPAPHLWYVGEIKVVPTSTRTIPDSPSVLEQRLYRVGEYEKACRGGC
jgi:hypothetical protein